MRYAHPVGVSVIKKHSEALIHRKDSELTALLKDRKWNPSLDLRGKIDAVRLELSLCLTTRAEKHLRWTKAKFYHQADRPGKLLARKLTPSNLVTSVPKIRRPDGILTQNPVAVLGEFQKLNQKLYQGPSPSGPQDFDSFVSNLPIPSLSEAHRELLDSEVTLSEVLQAIKQIKPAKAPGPGGFSALYFKKTCTYFSSPF